MQDIDYVMTLFTWPLRCSLSFLKNNIQTIELTARMRQHACSTRQDASYSYSANTRARQCGIRTRQQHTCTCTCTHVHMCASHMHAYGRTSRTCLQLGRPLQLSRSGRAWICFAIAELMARSGAAYIYLINMTKNQQSFCPNTTQGSHGITVPGHSKAYL